MFSSLSHLWSTRKKALLIIGASLGFLLLVFWLLTFLVGAEKPNPTGWQPAAVAAPQDIVRLAVEQNYQGAETRLDLNRVRVLPIRNKSNTVYVFDFNTPSLCGIGGCLYVVYTSKNISVLRLMLQPGLPKGVPLFTVSDKTHAGFPCLVVSQRIYKDNNHETVTKELLTKSLYCYSGSGFALFNTSVTELSTRR